MLETVVHTVTTCLTVHTIILLYSNFKTLKNGPRIKYTPTLIIISVIYTVNNNYRIAATLFPTDMVCFRYISVNTLHIRDEDDDDDFSDPTSTKQQKKKRKVFCAVARWQYRALHFNFGVSRISVAVISRICLTSLPLILESQFPNRRSPRDRRSQHFREQQSVL